MASSEVAVVGTGRMGSALVRRLAGAGHGVRVWNRTTGSARRLAASVPGGGVEVADSPASAVRDVDVVLCMLADGPASVEVLGDPVFLRAVPARAVVVNLATTGPEAADSLGRAFRTAGRRLLDAPVSGSVPTIDAGQLLVMASGDPADVDDARDVLGAFASTVLHVGPYGAGQVMKLGLNLVLLGVNALVSESLVLVERAGVDASAAYDVLEASVVSSSFVTYKRRAFLDAEAPVAMSLDLTAKDLLLVDGLAEAVEADLAVTRAVRRQVQDAVDHGYGEQDMAALRRYVAAGAAP